MRNAEMRLSGREASLVTTPESVDRMSAENSFSDAPAQGGAEGESPRLRDSALPAERVDGCASVARSLKARAFRPERPGPEDMVWDALPRESDSEAPSRVLPAKKERGAIAVAPLQ